MLGRYLLLFLLFVPFAYGDEFAEYTSVVGAEGEYLELNRLIVVDDAVVTLKCELSDPFSEEKKKLVVVGGVSSENNIKASVFYCSGISLEEIKVHWEPLPNDKFRLMLVISNESKWKGQWSVIVEASAKKGSGLNN